MDPVLIAKLESDIDAILAFGQAPTTSGILGVVEAGNDAIGIVVGILKQIGLPHATVAASIHAAAATHQLDANAFMSVLKAHRAQLRADPSKIDWGNLLGTILKSLPTIISILGPILGGLGAGS